MQVCKKQTRPMRRDEKLFMRNMGTGGADKYKKKTEPKPTGSLSHLPDDPGSVGGWLMVGEEHTHLQNIPTLPKSGHHRFRHLLILQEYFDTVDALF